MFAGLSGCCLFQKISKNPPRDITDFVFSPLPYAADMCMYVCMACDGKKKKRKKEKNPLIEMSLITRYLLKQDMYKKSIQMSLSLSHTHTRTH